MVNYNHMPSHTALIYKKFASWNRMTRQSYSDDKLSISVFSVPHLRNQIFSPSEPPNQGFQSFRSSETRCSALPNLQKQVFSNSAPPNAAFQHLRTSKLRFSALPKLNNQVSLYLS